MAYTTTGTGQDIAYRIVEANGSVGSQLIANTTAASDQSLPTIATLTDGSFMVAWASADGAIYAQKFNAADGSKSGSEITVDNTVSVTNSNPSIAALSGGNYVVTWADATNFNIYQKVGTGSRVKVNDPRWMVTHMGATRIQESQDRRSPV